MIITTSSLVMTLHMIAMSLHAVTTRLVTLPPIIEQAEANVFALLLILVVPDNPDRLEAPTSAFLDGLVHLRRFGVLESSIISGSRSATDNTSQSNDDGHICLKLLLGEVDTCLSVCRG